MKAFVYQGSAKKFREDRPEPEITGPMDAIVNITRTTRRAWSARQLTDTAQCNVVMAQKIYHIRDAYETPHAANTRALKMIIEA